MKRVLFVAEAVSLAHVARPYVLAKSLDPARFEIHFAAANRYPIHFQHAPVREWPLHSIEPADFLSALANGRPIYSRETLSRYVVEDLALLDAIRPDLVVGDFRLSLAVSAPLRGVHYIAIANAHWSPYSDRKSLPLPEHPLGATMGIPLASRLFNLVQPLVLARHAAPLNRVRRAYGLAPFAGLREAYTWADTTLYADVPELIRLSGLPSHHRYIGPVIWSPNVPTPGWWNQVGPGETCVYVTLGSSGQVRALSAVLKGLSGLPVTVLLATAERVPAEGLPENVRSAAYLPGTDAARRSAVVICNGGSATVYQALAEGKPVLGIPSNLDQHLTMAAVTDAGAGITLRAETVTTERVRESLRKLLGDPQYASRAREASKWISAYSAEQIFREVVALRLGV